ncbi:lipase family alpha/beta hydrolase [Microlunatus antarcticus]|uniref:Pimeloyl-ACP methyl ester carboxylesterase n=1 Tax=Microlunatus antarcticus TaxID=53388 RepID=A0A7W5JYS7_9ACTN|nr:lipase [Microlunatus antarcticus]MBB3328770.1 pimeloyl-ACP methyl ester carboxylesterase [Microlunatus antarcticus]
MLEALSPQRRRLVLGVLAVVALLVLALVVTLVVRAVTRDGPVPQDRPGPVLLVPGYGGRTASLDPLAAVLRSEGRAVTVVDLVGDGTGDLDAQADHLADVADGVLRTSGAPSVDVVGYSAGGVVVRLWVRDHGGAAQARRVLTLGSPQHGTSVAALGAEVAGGCPTACEQLLPDSPLLRRLNAGDETPSGPEWATVRSSADQVVTPTASAALDGALNVVVQDNCPDATTSHYELPADPVVAATLRSTLGAGPMASPGAAC